MYKTLWLLLLVINVNNFNLCNKSSCNKKMLSCDELTTRNYCVEFELVFLLD